MLSKSVTEAVQTALDNELVNEQENNLMIIGYLSAHTFNGQRPGNYNTNKYTILLMVIISSKRCYHKCDCFRTEGC